LNIFRTSSDPVECARVLSDQHVIKMAVESAQILATAVRLHGCTAEGLYKATHKGHPCTVWAASSVDAAEWVLDHAIALCEEFRRRFGKVHGSRAQIIYVMPLLRQWLPDEPFTPSPACVPDEFRHLPTEEAYRRTLAAKHAAWAALGRPARWTAPAVAPGWALSHEGI